MLFWGILLIVFLLTISSIEFKFLGIEDIKYEYEDKASQALLNDMISIDDYNEILYEIENNQFNDSTFNDVLNYYIQLYTYIYEK